MKEAAVLEPVFLLMFHGGFSFTEAYNLPVPYVRWFIERITKQLSEPDSDGNPPPNVPKTPEGKHAVSRIKKFK